MAGPGVVRLDRDFALYRTHNFEVRTYDFRMRLAREKDEVPSVETQRQWLDDEARAYRDYLDGEGYRHLKDIEGGISLRAYLVGFAALILVHWALMGGLQPWWSWGLAAGASVAGYQITKAALSPRLTRARANVTSRIAQEQRLNSAQIERRKSELQ